MHRKNQISCPQFWKLIIICTSWENKERCGFSGVAHVDDDDNDKDDADEMYDADANGADDDYDTDASGADENSRADLNRQRGLIVAEGGERGTRLAENCTWESW